MVDGKIERRFAYFPKIVNGKFTWMKNYFIVHSEKMMAIGGYEKIVSMDEYCNTLKEAVELLNL